MSNNFNSLSDIFDNLIRLTNNSLEIQQANTKAIISDSDNILLELTDSNGNTKSMSIPSWGDIQNRLNSLEGIVNILTGGTDIKAQFRLPDGTYRRIVEYKSDIAPQSFNTFNVPQSFTTRNNWFFESLLNPSLIVPLDIPNSYSDDISKVFVKRVILQISNDQQIEIWENDIKSKNDLDLNDLINLLDSNGISYFIDDNIMDLPLNVLKYNGVFDVLSINNFSIVENNQSILKTKYRLNKITYNDSILNTLDTLQLQIGDVLIVGNNTEYRIDEIDITTNEIVLSLIYGSEGVKIGSSIFKLKSEKSNIRTIDVMIANDEKQIIFIKGVDREIHIASENWSKGIAFDSNELTITTDSGVQRLDDYYNNSVFDLGKQYLELAKEKTIPSILGLTPNAPTLTRENFKVVQINTHATNTTQSDSVKAKYSESVKLDSEIKALNKTIEQKKQVLNQNEFASLSERNTARNEFNSLISEKAVKVTEYSSILTELTTISKDNAEFLVSPKYRLRGYFPIPDPKFQIKTGNQEVIQFEVQYRYLRQDGNNDGVISYKFNDTDSTERNASFSDWISVKSDIRTKKFDSDKGYYVWDVVNVEDAEIVNINQVDIPISKNEKVEFRVRSVSEAGYPINPKLSPWSESLIIEFPNSLNVGSETNFIAAQSDSENVRVKLLEELNSRGLDLLLAQTFTSNDKTYFLSSDSVNSGYFDQNGIIISLFQKLQEYENRIASLENKLISVANILKVFLVDDNGVSREVANNETITLNGGIYSEELSNTTNPNASDSESGKIVTKRWNLILQNNGASVIELAALFPGAFNSDLDINQTEFDYQKRLYHNAPINISGLEESDIVSPQIGNDFKTKNDSKINISNFQTKQVKSQFIYVRNSDVSLTENYYENYTGSEFWFEPLIPSTLIPNANIWNGNVLNGIPQGGGDLTEFSIHVDHPNLLDPNFIQLTNITDRMAYLLRPIDTSLPQNKASGYPKIRHSQFFNLTSNETNGTKQLQYIQANTSAIHTDVNLGNLNSTNGFMYASKQGFFENDEYLCGNKTCGSYLFLSSDKIEDTFVNGTDSLARKNLQSNSSISFSIVFQYRMTDKLGNIGGQNPNPLNLTYRKKIGIDIKTNNQTMFSFDIDVSSKFKRDNLVL